MKDEIRLREFQREDAQTIESIIREAWHYNDLCGPKTARKLAKTFLSSCLTNQTYTQVAIAEGTPVGVIMVNNIQEHICPAKYRIRQISAILSLFLSREGRTVSKIFSGVSEVDQILLKEREGNYKGELAFFAVAASVRGKGIGEMLFQSALDYMKSQDIDSFYLFTDTSCNYGFYEHQGMIRRGEKDKSFVVKEQEAKMKFFLYDYQYQRG